VLDLGPCHFEAGRCLSVIRDVTGALNRVRGKQIEKPILHVHGVNVHTDDLAYGQVLMELCAIKIMQLDNLDKPALECRRGFCNARRLYDSARGRKSALRNRIH
jgi:hypothetical protein